MMNSPDKISLFDILNNLNAGTSVPNLLEFCSADDSDGKNVNSPDSAYVSFMINRGLSFFQDTILYANEMNKHAHLPSKMQYDFYRHALRPRKRFSKWAKKSDDSEDVKLIMKRYSYSADKARDALKLYDKDALDGLRRSSDVGGAQKKQK
jgi:NACalpha-BTF3-like transcription factor